MLMIAFIEFHNLNFRNIRQIVRTYFHFTYDFRPWTKMPKFVNGDENCVVIIFGAVYINTACSYKRPYICERPAYGVSKYLRLFKS